MQISGRVTRRETRTGSFKDRQDETREVNFDFDVLTVQTEWDVIEVRVNPEQRALVSEVKRGDLVNFECDPPKDKFRLVEVNSSKPSAVRTPA